jgi:TonB family protein
VKPLARIVMVSVLFSCSALIGFSQSSSPVGKPSAGVEEEALGEVDKLIKEGVVGFGRSTYFVLGSRDPAEDKPKTAETIEVRVIKLPQPEYPARAKAVLAQGTVVVRAMVDEKGKVIAAQVETGHPMLKAAALKAAREAEFAPTLLKGLPIKIVGVINYNFTLQ